MISYFMLIKMTFDLAFKFLKSFIPDVCIGGYGLYRILTRYATIDATNIVVGITINAVIKLAIMGGVYVID